jgi:hypothetical protein
MFRLSRAHIQMFQIAVDTLLTLLEYSPPTAGSIPGRDIQSWDFSLGNSPAIQENTCLKQLCCRMHNYMRTSFHQRGTDETDLPISRGFSAAPNFPYFPYFPIRIGDFLLSFYEDFLSLLFLSNLLITGWQ